MSSPRFERGWVGLLLLLVALVIVAFAARTALKQYGLVPDAGKTVQASAPPRSAAEAAAITPGNALEQARGVQDMVKQGAIDQEKRIDDAIPK